MRRASADCQRTSGANPPGQESECLAFGQLAEEVQAAMASGRQPDIGAIVSKYPQLADQIEQMVPALKALDELGHEPSQSTPVVAGSSRFGCLGDFRINREIGRGGMGVVYEAEQVSLGRRLALKVLPFAATLDPRQLQRFRNEAQAAAALEHPNIVNIHAVGCERGVHYYAMQYIDGQTLAQVIEELRRSSPLPCAGEGPRVRAEEPQHPAGLTQPGSESSPLAPRPSSLPPDTLAAVSTKGSNRTAEFFRSVAQLGIQAAEALEHAHQMGVVHRDIKPSNLMVDASGHLWVTDFGLAMTQKDPALTMTGDIVGTLRYMSPEQALGDRRQMDHRSDIYSLGVTLYELLTLQPAFAGDNRETLVRRLLEEDPPRPRTVNRAIPKDLETIVLKATAKEPQQRYATAQEFADDLKRFLADEPIRARRTGPVVRLKKWIKRHKAVTAVVGAVLLAAAIFGTVTAVQAYQRDVRLTAMATEGVADVRVAMAQKEFGQAQRRATEIQAEVAAAPKVKAQFGPELEDLLHQAEVRLRLQRFEKVAEEARFSANRLLLPGLRGDPADARRCCREALAILHVLDNERWLEDLERLPLERAEVTEIKQSLVEILFLLAAVEVRFGDGASGARRGIALLNQVEALAPNLRALYEYRGRYWTIVGDNEAARSDSHRASTMQPNTWLDHYFRALELRPTNSAEGLREVALAITFRPDDYWSWFLWSEFQQNRNGRELWYWGYSICIRLRPDEASAWIWRAGGTGDNETYMLGAIADLSRALDLTTDPVLRMNAYKHLADNRWKLGQPEAALSDCNSAIRLDPHNGGAFLYRALCYRVLRQWEKARADARRAVELYDERTDVTAAEGRLTALTILGQPQDAVEVAVAMYKSKGLRDWLRSLEGVFEFQRIPQKAFALAMARWKLGDKDQARRWYEKGVQWMDKTQNKDLFHFLDDKDLPRLRDETAAMLGIPVKPSAAKEKTEEKPKAESEKRK